METEISPQISWHNEGICNRYSIEKIQDTTLRALYMYFVRYSFGYGKKVTNRTSQLEMSKKLKIDKKTLASHMKYLIENKFVKVIHSKHNPKGGGSESYAYAPTYPTGYGKIYFEDDIKSPTSSGSKKQEPEKWSSENLTFYD